MKSINKKITMSILGSMAILGACQEPFDATPKPASTASAYSTNFLFVNASPDAPALDFFVNNAITGATAASDTTANQAAYTNVKITSNGVLANTAINAVANSGTIGGVLGGSKIIFRSSNNGTGNLTATDLKGYTGTGKYWGYTVFAVDSISRPVPIRTLNSGNFGDITYYSTKSSFTAKSLVDGVTDTTIQLNVASNNSVTIANLVKKYNANVLPSFLIPVGIVPLGSSDPGGVRFYVTQDVFPVYSKTDSTTKAAFRFVNTSPTSAAAVTSSSYVSTLYVRLVGTNTITVSSGASYVMANANFNPSVGSRNVTASSANFTAATLSAAPATYEIQVSTTSNFSAIVARQSGFVFTAGKNYTIYTKGLVGGTGSKRIRIGVIQYN